MTICGRILISAAIALLAADSAFGASDVVRIETGRIKGVVRDGIVAFKGIPFAAPPAGELRWRPPQRAKAWMGVRSAAEYGPDCPQYPFPNDVAPLATTPSEDCLNVNVWVPQGAAKYLPVLVWIHGGGFVNGGSTSTVYDGVPLAKRGLVFMSINYRVGRFGFFAHPALSKESPNGALGNYGFMDQIAALEWVQRNARAFGGNPGNVTIFGQSAGGASVLALMTSPLAKGLFARAIVNSGGGRDLMSARRYLNRTNDAGLPSAETAGLAFAKSNGIDGEDAAALAALRKLPADAVVAGLNMATANVPTYSGPMIDGKLVVESPAAAYAAGRGARVPTLVGATSADIGRTRARDKEELFAQFGADRELARKLYDPDGSAPFAQVSAAVGCDRSMLEPSRFLAKAIAGMGLPAYQFRFSYVAESKRGQWRGAPHFSEIPFVFDTVAFFYGKDLADADRAIARAAIAYWSNFVKTGNPNGDGLPEWPAYSLQADELMDFTLNGPVGKADPWKGRLDLAEKLAAGK
jgi:para-nitrobenzyl esterase